MKVKNTKKVAAPAAPRGKADPYVGTKAALVSTKSKPSGAKTFVGAPNAYNYGSKLKAALAKTQRDANDAKE